MGNKLAKNQQDTLSAAYLYDFGAPVWRIRPDTATGSLALEVRDGEVLLAHFYTLCSATFTLTQLSLPGQQGWWQGLEDAQSGMVYLHGYGDRKLGQHKGITSLTAAGHPQWEAPALAFYGIGAKGLYAYQVAAPENGFRLLDLHTGAVAATGISQHEAAAAVTGFNSTRYGNCVYPVLYQEGEPYFQTVQGFLEEHLAAAPVRAIEYAETGSSIVISFYLAGSGNLFTNEVVVFDLEGRLRLRATLADGISGIGSDTFFIFRDYLFFIQHKTVLQAYLLPAS